MAFTHWFETQVERIVVAWRQNGPAFVGWTNGRMRMRRPFLIESLESRALLCACMGSPPVFDSSGYSFGVLEDASLVGSVHATDPDSDIIDYSLSGSDSGNFSIDSSGNISAYMLDFESQITHYFDVTVTDMMGYSATVPVSVVVSDVDENPVFGAPVAPATAFEFTISEMAHNDDVVGEIPVSDPPG